MRRFFKQPIFTGLSPNAEKDDVLLAIKLLFQPQTWREGSARLRLEAAMKERLGVRHAFAFESGRTSLMMALKTLDLKDGDEVLLQAFTCVAVPNAVRWAGGLSAYVDCDPASLTMDPDDLKKKITPRSRAVIIQHTFGDPGDLSALLAVARTHNLVVIEDCAHTIGGEYEGKKLGTFGEMAVFSFGRDKAISSVFGGLLVVNDDSRAHAIRALYDASPCGAPAWIAKQLLHPLITAATIATFEIGVGKIILALAKKLGILSLAVLKEERMGERPSFVGKRMSNALCLLALHQLNKLDRTNAHRRSLTKKYNAAFDKRFTIHDSRFTNDRALLRYSLHVDNPEKLMRAAKSRGIYLGDWYRQPVAPDGVQYEKIGYTQGSCPNAEEAARHIINLPLDIHITKKDADRIIAIVNTFELRDPTVIPSEAKRSRGIYDGSHQTQIPRSTRDDTQAWDDKGFEVREIRVREEWNSFFVSISPHSFLQSWEYGEFQCTLGEMVYRLGVYDGDQLIACCCAIVIRAKRGSILFVPQGPILGRLEVRGNRFQHIFSTLVQTLKEIARDEKCVCTRVSSLFENSGENKKMFSDLGFRHAPTFMHPERAWILDITSDEQLLLSAMRKTTRYSIKKAEKDGVTISSAGDSSGIEPFYALYQKTVERQHFVPFSKKYIEAECAAFAKNGYRFFFAHYNGEIVAGALIIFTESSAFYHHGASTHPKIPAPYLLQWNVIQEAKRRGCRFYNFWGIAPDDQSNHPWAGLSLFKKGFGGRAEEYLPAHDLVLSPRYWLTYVIEWLRRKKRGL